MAGDYKIRFRDLKERVGIDDVAYSLGYRIDRKAGVGRYIELVLGEGRDKRDTIIVSNRRDKGSQFFFRRDGSKGDVVAFIRENLNSFNVSGMNEWQKIAKVMAQFANMPEPDYDSHAEYVRAASVPQIFDPSRYDVRPLDTEKIHPLFRQRGISDRTVRTLAPFISLVSDRHNENFSGYNIGFPYTAADSDRVLGYEIRGMSGYKSKAAGTNSSTAAWVADLSGGNGASVRSVFFCESAFDAMAFYQLNRLRAGDNIALVSIGGTFSDRQILGVMERFPNARAFDCFDNDLPGRVNGLRLMALTEDLPLRITKTDDGLKVEAKGKSFPLTPERALYAQVAEHLPVRYRMGQWQPPSEFKDWNDCLLGKRLEPTITPSKLDRDNNLAGKRKSGLKI